MYVTLENIDVSTVNAFQEYFITIMHGILIVWTVQMNLRHHQGHIHGTVLREILLYDVKIQFVDIGHKNHVVLIVTVLILVHVIR
jgi:hypothetical protein